jgi:DNA gyrase subunit B
LRELSYLIPTCKYTLENHRGAEPVIESFRTKGGLAAFCEHLNKNKTPLHRNAIHFAARTTRSKLKSPFNITKATTTPIVAFGNTIHNIHRRPARSGFKTGLDARYQRFGRKKGILKERKST